jgi:hypothetical protein
MNVLEELLYRVRNNDIIIYYFDVLFLKRDLVLAGTIVQNTTYSIFFTVDIRQDTVVTFV